MANLCEDYLGEHAAQHKKPSGATEDKRNIDNHVIPLLGASLVATASFIV